MQPNINKSTASGAAELDVQWNPSQVCTDLQIASSILSDRCLQIAGKFITEQWMGLPPDVISIGSETGATTATSGGSNSSSIPDHLHVAVERNPAVAYAKVLIESAEYSFAAAVLSETSLNNPDGSVETMNPPLSDLTPKAIYYRAYALYLAGERMRTEEAQALESQGLPNAAVQNPHVLQLQEELTKYYHESLLDPFGLYVYGIVLKERKEYRQAQEILVESILAFPYNWSAWVDLVDVQQQASSCDHSGPLGDGTLHPMQVNSSNNKATTADVEQQLDALHSHFMYHFFCGYSMSERQQHADAMAVYERWMDPSLFCGSPYLLSQYAITAYNLRDFDTAAQVFRDLHHHMPYRLDHLDVYSNILYVQHQSVALCQLAHTATTIDAQRPETHMITGNYYSLKHQRAAAVASFQRAVDADPTYAAAYTLMGHEYVEWKQTTQALHAYRQAIKCSAASDYRAWYGLGQTYELMHLYVYAAYYYQKAVALRPYDARMWSALGSVLLAMDQTDAAILAFRRADEDPVAVQKLACLYRERGNVEEAAACCLKHLELRNPNKSAVAPGPRRLEHMLQSILVESTEASAILYLAGYHRDKGEYDIATTFAQHLLDYPGPEKEHAKAMLREIQTRRGHGMVTRSKAAASTGGTSFEFTPDRQGGL